MLPLILLAVPFLDTTFVVLKRLKYRRPIYASDSEHFHHRMARIGSQRWRTIAYLYGWTLLLAGFALALRFVPYSDHKGHLYLGWTLVIVALALFVALASVYLWYVLETRVAPSRRDSPAPPTARSLARADRAGRHAGLRDRRVSDDRLVRRLRVILGACALAASLALPAGASALVVGIGEQHPAMFGDPRFSALDIRYARLVIGWNALESRSESRAIRSPGCALPAPMACTR